MKRPLQFVISETFENWSPEDVEHGEPSDRGFNFEDQLFDHEELSDHLNDNGFIHPSQSPIRVDASNLWTSTEADQDFSTGEEEIKALHCKKVLDGNGNELPPALADRAWNKLVADAAGQKLVRPTMSGPSL